MLVKEYKWGYAASFWSRVIFLPDQAKRNESDMSMMRTNIGGYKIDCHMVAELSMLRRPKAKKRTSGEALTKASTTPFRSPAGDMAGAKPMKTSTLLLRVGWMDSVAKA